MYAGEADADARLYGFGFSYARALFLLLESKRHRLVEDSNVDRADMERRIRAHEFDLVIFGSVQRGMPLWSAVVETYGREDVAFVDGEDQCVITYFEPMACHSSKYQ